MDMLTLRSKDIMDQESVKCLTVIWLRGKQLYGLFVKERLRTQTIYGIDGSHHQGSAVQRTSKKDQKKSQKTVALLRSWVLPFLQGFVARQTIYSDLDTIFSHENHPFPPCFPLADCYTVRLE